MKKCLFISIHWSTVINLCNMCKLHNLQKLFQFESNLQNEEMSFRFPLGRMIPLSICVICANCTICKFRSTHWSTVPLSISVICANCTICKSGFQFECSLQNEEMSSRSTRWSTVINLCNLCKLYNLQKRFSI